MNLMILPVRLFVFSIIFAATVLSLMASNRIENALPGYRPYLAAACGIAFSFVLYAFISWILRAKSQLATTNIIRLDSSLHGLGIALIAFNFSLAAFSFTHKINFGGFDYSNLFSQLLFQVRPALIEEVGFRFGLALFASIYFGRTAGVIAGALPFGIMHLLNFATGQPIIWNYILGTTVAGALLTLIFFRHGLLAAILAHYCWNVFASVSARSFSFQQEALEGAATTFAVLAFFCVRLWLQLKNFSFVTQNPK